MELVRSNGGYEGGWTGTHFNALVTLQHNICPNFQANIPQEINCFNRYLIKRKCHKAALNIWPKHETNVGHPSWEKAVSCKSDQVG